ncbi:hypothetical protein KM176_16410 [Pseudooceanicola sp. CBS1P-1]|uniref:Uncharacterized protein n=1 Tax=Pseudooceanicola albus TaxID=2692189 RepID=A0A6L7G761_9RHOB|nr:MULTISPECIES: hypothetical protein [Pseudooceanicola]MBT9385458.1 hypothetical protein [Pseudooceanicola endophyticus]MXN19130.1 hypothetical protein [Pseudooceanicola albus]
MNIINKTIPLTEAIMGLLPHQRKRLTAQWEPFQQAGIERAVIRYDGWEIAVVEPTPEFVRFCAQRGVVA